PRSAPPWLGPPRAAWWGGEGRPRRGPPWVPPSARDRGAKERASSWSLACLRRSCRMIPPWAPGRAGARGTLLPSPRGSGPATGRGGGGGRSLRSSLSRAPPVQAACVPLLGDGRGIVVREGSRRSPAWQGGRPRGWAPGSRTATGLAEHVHARRAHGGRRIPAALPRVGQRGPARPPVGPWRAWEGRWAALVHQPRRRAATAGRLAQRWTRA